MVRPLRVVMPALTYVPGAMGGSETYAKALIATLDDREDVDLTVIVSKSAAGALGARSEYVLRTVLGRPSTLSRLAAIALGAAGDRRTRALMRGADLVHYPFTVPVPRSPRGIPWLVTLHDVQHRDLPSMFSPAERWYRSIAYDSSARHATRVVTVSEFCRERISAAIDIPTERIDVALNGVDPERFDPSDTPRESFVFYPATAWPHKNHQRLVSAMQIVREQRPEFRLVLTGGRREALGVLPRWVEHRGVVSDQEVLALYRSASCLAFPSLYEGFGLPVLEAIASGCPVAAANTGAISELGLSCVVLCDPTSSESIADAVLAACAMTRDTIDRGLAMGNRFSWLSSASAHVDAYRRAANR